jgi:hypothetical protein
MKLFVLSLGDHLGHPSALLESLLEVTGHVESTFGVIITSSLEECGEAVDGFGKLDELAWLSGEDLTHEEWLRQESLNLSGSGDGQLVLFGELVHTQNSDNILEGLVVLEELLHSSGAVVMDITNNGGVQHS